MSVVLHNTWRETTDPPLPTAQRPIDERVSLARDDLLHGLSLRP